MQKGLSLYKKLPTFFRKIKIIGVFPKNTILVTADIVGLHPKILHHAGLKALKEALEKRDIKKIPREDLVKMTEFVLKCI